MFDETSRRNIYSAPIVGKKVASFWAIDSEFLTN